MHVRRHDHGTVNCLLAVARQRHPVAVWSVATICFGGRLLKWSSIAAQTPDTLESLAVSKKGYGSMAVANCLGTQTINIGIGLGLPWTFSAASGSIIELEESLLVPCWIMIFLLLTNLFILYTDVIFRGHPKVILGRTRAYLMSITYFLSITMYAFYLVMIGEL